MTQPPENDHSYEPFARLPFNQAIDERLLAMGPRRVGSHTDLATGSGAVIGHCFRLGMYEGASWNATGVDVDDSDGLAVAAARFKHLGDHVRLIPRDIEQEIPEIPPESQDLVTFFNAIHLTDPILSLREAARIAKPGATLLVSSAYEKSANPEPAGRMLLAAMITARRILKEQGFSDFSRNESLMQYSNDEYKAMAEAAGFTDVEIVTYQAQMDREVLRAIFDSRDFALGAFPAVPLDEAAAALVASIGPMLERFGRETLPRNYMLLKATRAGLPIAA